MITVNKPCCIDIYHGNEVSDNPTALAGLDLAKKAGIFILIHKASEGTNIPDSRYDARRAKWMSGGPVSIIDIDGAPLSLSALFGAYHFFHGINATAEAKFFLSMARLKAQDMPFIDWEAVGASGFQPSLENADAFCQAVEDVLGRVCGVYGGNVPRERFAAEKASSAVLERFSKRPLWFCGYGGVKDLNILPEPWKETGALLWQDDGDQYGPGPHTIPGLSGYCDNSTVVSPMTFARLHAEWLNPLLIGAASVPTPIPTTTLAPTMTAPIPTTTPVPKSNLESLEAELHTVEGEVETIKEKIEKDLS